MSKSLGDSFKDIVPEICTKLSRRVGRVKSEESQLI